MSLRVATSKVKVSKTKTILFGLIIIVGLTAIVLYMIPWGEAKSEIKELEVTEESQKVEIEPGIEINDIGELSGTYITYDVDSSTSELMFSLDALQGTIGKFKVFDVEFVSGELPSVVVNINPSSIYTANRMRDKELLDEGFFKVNEFPSIRFVSSAIEMSDSGYVAVGKVDMLGVGANLSFPFTYKGKSKNYKGLEVAIFEGKFVLNRTEFGMEHVASVGDNVSVSFTMQLEKQNE